MKRPCWTPAEDQLLRREYPHRATREIAILLDRSERATYSRAAANNLRKTRAYLEQQAKRNLFGPHAAGAGHRFRPGQAPWNKGRKGYQAGGRSVDTQYRAGNRPHGWRPIGSLRTTKDGYHEIKLTDTGPARHDWVGIHRLIWQQHHGPIPAGHCIIFIDLDKTHLAIENLDCISRRIHAWLNKQGFSHIAPELRAAAIALAKVDVARRRHQETAA